MKSLKQGTYGCRRIVGLVRKQRNHQFLPALAATQNQLRRFHQSTPRNVVRPYLLADIGEGITECQIISWSVKPGDRVEQFDPICEVQSDKATVEITSRFDGVIKALHYAQDEVAIVGQALLDMDIAEEVAQDPILAQTTAQDDKEGSNQNAAISQSADQLLGGATTESPQTPQDVPTNQSHHSTSINSTPNLDERSPLLVTPAIRHLLKTENINPAAIRGTGKGGRITKEDVMQYMAAESMKNSKSHESTSVATPGTPDQIVPLTATEHQMFKVMTRSLQIPHFLYTHNVDVGALNRIRQTFNRDRSANIDNAGSTTKTKLSVLPFILKAVSQAFMQRPRLNSHIDTTSNPAKPQLIVKSAHNFGVAIDTPHGLLVPVVRNIQEQSILSLATEINRLSILAQAGKLAPGDFKDATFTISNIGSIGGGVVNPVIVEPMVGILAVGRAEAVPVFHTDSNGLEKVVKEERITLSWSADHRVLDGATVARVAELVSESLRNVETWCLKLR